MGKGPSLPSTVDAPRGTGRGRGGAGAGGPHGPGAPGPPEDAQPRVHLVVSWRGGVRAEPLVEGAPLTVGRGPECHLALDDPTLSRPHATFLLKKGTVQVQDRGSHNGTRVGGIEAKGPAKVAPGVEVELGAVTVVVQVLRPAEARALGVASHDQFLGVLDERLAMARTHGWPVALVLLQPVPGAVAATPPAAGHNAAHFAARVARAAAPGDPLALLGPGTLELLVTARGAEDAAALAAALVRAAAPGEPPLRAGVAAFPAGASSAEELLEAARGALDRGTAKHPVQLAPSRASVALTPAPASSPEPASGAAAAAAAATAGGSAAAAPAAAAGARAAGATAAPLAAAAHAAATALP
ncbi:MAG TPA: FHA domain-containing protein, partial [Myxococcota bacterium]|nr:FHA domain-containing protein [Myxococcota bacterium]